MRVTSVHYGILLFAASLLAGCAAPRCARPVASPRLSCEQSEIRTIYLVRHGWHTSLAFKRCEISAADWPECEMFPNVRFIEVGWGDADYLGSSFLNPLVAVKAGCLPSRSAIHVAGFQESPCTFFADSQIIEIKMTPRQMQQLCRFVHTSYCRKENQCPIHLGGAQYGVGGIYQSTGFYFVPNTCNVWTAKALASAELPVLVPLCTFAQPLVCQCKSFGREIQSRSSIVPVVYPFCNFEKPQPH